MSEIVYRLEDGSEWLGRLSYEEARDGDARTLAFLAARHSGPMQDADPSRWIEARGAVYTVEGGRARTFLRPSAVIAFHVKPSASDEPR